MKDTRCTCTYLTSLAYGWKPKDIKGHHESCPISKYEAEIKSYLSWRFSHKFALKKSDIISPE